MQRRYFVRVLAPFANFRAEHEVALDSDEFQRVKGKGLVTVLHEERDGKRVDVVVDEGAAAGPPKKMADEDLPLDTLTDEEKEIILKRRAAGEKKKADDESRAKAAADKKAKDEADAAEKAAAKAKADAEKAEKKKAEDEAKAKAAADKK